MLTKLIRLPYVLWLLCSLPALGMVSALLTSSDPEIFEELLHGSGELAARFMIIAMLATPLTMLLKGWRGPRFIMRHRRHFGVAAFGYGLLHTIFYLLDAGAAVAVSAAELGQLYIWTGWIAFAIFIPLAATSMDLAIRKLGPRRWKRIQQSTYVAALFTFVHWAALHDWSGLLPALVHFVPVLISVLYRLWAAWRRRGTPVPA